MEIGGSQPNMFGDETNQDNSNYDFAGNLDTAKLSLDYFENKLRLVCTIHATN